MSRAYVIGRTGKRQYVEVVRFTVRPRYPETDPKGGPTLGVAVVRFLDSRRKPGAFDASTVLVESTSTEEPS